MGVMDERSSVDPSVLLEIEEVDTGDDVSVREVEVTLLPCYIENLFQRPMPSNSDMIQLMEAEALLMIDQNDLVECVSRYCACSVLNRGTNLWQSARH